MIMVFLFILLIVHLLIDSRGIGQAGRGMTLATVPRALAAARAAANDFQVELPFRAHAVRIATSVVPPIVKSQNVLQSEAEIFFNVTGLIDSSTSKDVSTSNACKQLRDTALTCNRTPTSHMRPHSRRQLAAGASIYHHRRLFGTKYGESAPTTCADYHPTNANRCMLSARTVECELTRSYYYFPYVQYRGSQRCCF